MTTARALAVVAILSTLAFVWLSVLMRSGSTAEIDGGTMHAVRELASPALDRIMLAVTTVGGSPALVLIVAFMVLWCAWRRDRRAAFALAVVGLGSEAANQLLKEGFQRARPELWPRPQLLSYAFPSGHAMASMACFGMMAIVLARAYPRATPALWIGTPLLILAVGASRVYLGVHWPSDVLAGFAAGLVLLIIGELALLRYRR